MKSLLGSLGPVGLAVLLTVVLILGTKAGGKFKPLNWGWTLALSILAGASYAAAPWPFTLVRAVINDGLDLLDSVMPGLSLPAIGLCMAAIIAWKKMTTRGVALIGIPFWYVASASDGALGTLADKIAVISQNLAA